MKLFIFVGLFISSSFVNANAADIISFSCEGKDKYNDNAILTLDINTNQASGNFCWIEGDSSPECGELKTSTSPTKLYLSVFGGKYALDRKTLQLPFGSYNLQCEIVDASSDDNKF